MKSVDIISEFLKKNKSVALWGVSISTLSVIRNLKGTGLVPFAIIDVDKAKQGKNILACLSCHLSML